MLSRLKNYFYLIEVSEVSSVFLDSILFYTSMYSLVYWPVVLFVYLFSYFGIGDAGLIERCWEDPIWLFGIA